MTLSQTPGSPAQAHQLGDHDAPPLPPSLRELRLLEAFSNGERSIALAPLAGDARLVAATVEPRPALHICADHVSNGLSWQRQDGFIGGKVLVIWQCTSA